MNTLSSMLIMTLKIMASVILGAAITFVFALIAFLAVLVFAHDPLSAPLFIIWAIASAGIFTLLN